MLCEQCNQQTAWRCEKSKGRECGCVPGTAPKRRQIWLEIVVGGVSQVGSWLAAYLQCPASAEMAGLWCTHEKHAQGGVQLLCQASSAGSILVAKSGGHVLEGAPGSVVDAAHHGLDLLARAQLVQLVLACAAGDSWWVVVGQWMISWNNHAAQRNGSTPNPPLSVLWSHPRPAAPGWCPPTAPAPPAGAATGRRSRRRP